MPECIVCKGYYDPDEKCPRCGSDNASWGKWLTDEPVEIGGVRGLLHFTDPHCHAPFFFTATALAFGLMGIGGLWEGVRGAVRLLAVVVTVGGCLIIVQVVYGMRHKVRETELLARVRLDRAKKFEIPLGPRAKATLTPIIAIVLVVLLVFALIRSGILWKLTQRLLLEEVEEEAVTPAPGEEEEPAPPTDSFWVRARQVFPLFLMFGYGAVFLALTYSSSMALALHYVGRMNQALPHPIFLQDKKLACVVRREAEVELGRVEPECTNVSNAIYAQMEGQVASHQLRLPPSVDMPGAERLPLSARVDRRVWVASWVWDELERTEDGGIEMKVARQEVYRLPTPDPKGGYRFDPRVCYIVRADPWGRVIKIKRDGK